MRFSFGKITRITLSFFLMFGFAQNISAQTSHSKTSSAKDPILEELLELDIEEISVSVASKREESISQAPGVITVITAEEIEKFGGNNLGDILSRLPNTFRITTPALRDNTTSIRGLQGSFDSRTLVLINGRPFRDGFSGGFNASFYRSMPLEIIERVEAVRGPSSVLYGTNALSGVINVITKNPKESHANELTGGYGSDDTVQGSGLAIHRSGDFNFIVSGRYLDSDGWSLVSNDPIGNTFADNFSEKNAGVIGIANYKNFTFTGFSGFRRDKTFSIVTLQPLAEQENLRRDFFDAEYDYTHSDSWKSKLNITYNGLDFTENSGIDSNFSDTLFEVSSGGEISQNINMVFGGIYQKLVGDLSDGRISYTNDRFNFYGQADYTPLDFLKLIAGFNVSKPEGIDFNVTPRFGAILHSHNKFGVKLLYGEAFRSPFAAEQATNDPFARGNPNLDPEESQTFNAQIFYNTPKIYSALTYYQSTVEKAIRLTPDIGFNTFRNRGESDFEGIEWEWKAYPLSGWLFTGSISYQTNEDQDRTQDTGLIPNFMAKTGLAYESTSGISFGIFNSYFGDAADLPAATQVNPTADSYNWLTLKSSLDLPKYFLRSDIPNAKLNLFVDNILDEDMHSPQAPTQRVNSFPARRGIGVFASATLRF